MQVMHLWKSAKAQYCYLSCKHRDLLVVMAVVVYLDVMEFLETMEKMAAPERMV